MYIFILKQPIVKLWGAIIMGNMVLPHRKDISSHAIIRFLMGMLIIYMRNSLESFLAALSGHRAGIDAGQHAVGPRRRIIGLAVDSIQDLGASRGRLVESLRGPHLGLDIQTIDVPIDRVIVDHHRRVRRGASGRIGIVQTLTEQFRF